MKLNKPILLIVGIILFITAQFTEIEWLGYIGLGIIAIIVLIYIVYGWLINPIKDIFKLW